MNHLDLTSHQTSPLLDPTSDVTYLHLEPGDHGTSLHQSDPSSRVTFNVGGVTFQTLESTVRRSANHAFKVSCNQLEV